MKFEDLTPHVVIDIVEEALGINLTGFASSFPSYINRVYELETVEKDRLVAKFYRPDRWLKGAIQDEHDFTIECYEEDVPVVPPIKLANGSTLGEKDGIFFAVFEKRGGRKFEVLDDESWNRMGSLIGRMHMVGARGSAENRVVLHPEKLTRKEVDYLLAGDFITSSYKESFRRVMDEIILLVAPRFDDFEYIRIHADCHCANILNRMDEGLMLIDFDDMMMGPAVQDLWLLLPDHFHNSRREFDLMLDGYEQFVEFDYFSVKLIEPLRMLRILYFLSWCARQSSDYKFQHNFPDWGSDSFWRRELNDLQHQLNVIKEDDRRRAASYG